MLQSQDFFNSKVSRKGAKYRKVILCVALRLCEKKIHFGKLSILCSWLAARCSSPPCVRDWSGILCERSRILESETDVEDEYGIWKRDSVAAEKDIAESPTAERSGDGTPKERRLQVNKTT
ncbi:MAG: hypothetical protein J6R17_07910 [Bacteroidales bacterium]|nr:hypothetical protein [Bacteroidales bacterium]